MRTPEDAGANDRNTTKGLQHQKVVIAGNDQIGMTIDRQLQELIVRRVATANDCLGYSISSAAMKISCNVATWTGDTIFAIRGLPNTSNSSLSVASDFSIPPGPTIHCVTKPGQDDAFNAALIKTFVSTNSLIYFEGPERLPFLHG